MNRYLLAAALIAAPTIAVAERPAQTPSGLPDAVYEGSTVKDVASKLANACMNRGWQVTGQTETQVTCEIPVNGMKQALQQVLLGNSYSTPPRTFARFTIAQVGTSARAQGMAWTETQMAFGQMRQQQYSDDGTYTNLLGFLLQAGGELPPGSTFTGNYIGFDGQAQNTGSKVGIPVTRVFAGAPGSAAGLQVGDVVTKVNGQAFKSMDDFGKKLAKVGVGNRYPLTVTRDGKEVTLQVTAAPRPPVGSPEYAALVAQAKTAAGTPPAPTTQPVAASTAQ